MNKKVEIDKKGISEKVYNILIDSIIDGQLKFGEKLNIRNIANDLGVSPMPVRDAIKKLSIENFVKIIPRSYCKVTIPKKKYILELFEIRKMIEIFSLKKYFRNNHNEKQNLSKLEEYLKEMDKSRLILKNSNNDAHIYKKLITLDTLFHKELVLLIQNKEMINIYDRVCLQVNMVITYRICDFPYEEKIHQDHKMIFKYLKHKSQKSIILLEQHLEYIEKKICNSNVL